MKTIVLLVVLGVSFTSYASAIRESAGPAMCQKRGGGHMLCSDITEAEWARRRQEYLDMINTFPEAERKEALRRFQKREKFRLMLEKARIERERRRQENLSR